MKCTNCGVEFSDNYRFCPECATPVTTAKTQPPEVEPIAVNSEYQPEVYSAPIKKKPKWILPVAIVLSLLLICGTIFAGLYFGTDIFAKGDGKCDLCEKEISKKDTYCTECIEKKTCKECKEFNLDSVDGYCPNCMKCRGCDEDIEKGYYCDECLDTLSYADNYMGTGEVCAGCFIKTLRDTSYVRRNYLLENKLANEEVFLIGENGFLYCKDCESDKLCKGCKGFLTADDDDDICAWCVELDGYAVCSVCTEVVPLKNGKPDCKDCKDCKECGDKIAKSDGDGLCSWCSEFRCAYCYRGLDEEKVDCEFTDEYGDEQFVCKDCFSGKYCKECDEVPLEKGNETGICRDCAEYFCYGCDNVLTKKMISYTYEDDDGDEYNYCKECDTKKYCKDCGYVLSIYDCDKVCSNCADYACDGCGEVLKKKEISYEYENEDDEYIICKLCDSGKYCKDCDEPLSKYDDDKVCRNCAEYACWECSEVLKEKEISHEYERWEEYYYICKECNTGKYCEECDYMLEGNDDDDVCNECAEYACWECSEVLKESEFSYNFTTEYGDERYYCEACDTGEYCTQCYRPLEDGECWYCD